MENRSQKQWRCESFSIGWQVFDPASNRFIREGEWTPLTRDTGPGEAVPVDLNIDFPPETGDYRIYVSPIDTESGWLYDRGERFLMIDAVVANERAAVVRTELTTRRALLRRGVLRAIPRIFSQPFATMTRHRALIRSMVRRDIMARYRGSFGDLFWTVLNPLLLMLTYFLCSASCCELALGADPSPPEAFCCIFWRACCPGWRSANRRGVSQQYSGASHVC